MTQETTKFKPEILRFPTDGLYVNDTSSHTGLRAKLRRIVLNIIQIVKIKKNVQKKRKYSFNYMYSIII